MAVILGPLYCLDIARYLAGHIVAHVLSLLNCMPYFY